MTTKRETILSAIATLLSSTSGVSGHIYRSRTEAIRREETPAITVEPVQDTASYGVIDFMEWALQFKVTIFTRGAVPDNLADPIVQSAYSLLMADRSLGGRVFDILPIGVYYQILDGDQPIGVTEMMFQTQYRTKASDLTQ